MRSVPHLIAATLVVALTVACGHGRRAASPTASPTARGAAVEGEDPGWAQTPPVHPQVAATTSPGKILAEADRELHAMRTTEYKHKSHVDEQTGTYIYDCSGFVAYVLRNALPEALAPIPIGIKGRPRAEDFTQYFAGLTDDANEPWIRVPRGSEIQPGDIVAWLRPSDVENSNTGHIFIVQQPLGVAPPSKAVTKAGGARELLLRVVDSTESPHADDVRGTETEAGLGTGTVGLVVDGSDTPIGYRWKGGQSAKAFTTLVAIARAR